MHSPQHYNKADIVLITPMYFAADGELSWAARRQVALACNILDGSCFREDPSKTISVQVCAAPLHM